MTKKKVRKALTRRHHESVYRIGADPEAFAPERGESMSKLVVMIMMVGLIWVAMEVNSKSTTTPYGAFSFLNAGDSLPEKASAFVTTPRRVGAKVDAAIQEGAARYENMLEE